MPGAGLGQRLSAECQGECGNGRFFPAVRISQRQSGLSKAGFGACGQPGYNIRRCGDREVHVMQVEVFRGLNIGRRGCQCQARNECRYDSEE